MTGAGSTGAEPQVAASAADLAGLRALYGPFCRPLQRICVALLDAPTTLPALVAATGAPRRTIEQVLEALSPDLHRDGPEHGARTTYRLPTNLRQRYETALDLPALTRRTLDDLVGTRLAGDPMAGRAMELLASLADDRPAPDRDLDHVAADLRTLVRRALWLDASYDLTAVSADRFGLLCVGDHDLTSLAVAACVPSARVAVADIDDRVLEFIDAQARRRGWDITCCWGDFRSGLPASLHEGSGVAFTDPPYTPEGVTTFLTAAAQGLADRDRGRIVLAYGYGEHQPALGLKVQQAVVGMHLATEAVLPSFNAYHGAQAIGSRSDLYVLQPTARTWRALPAIADRAAARLYTHGGGSLESSGDSDAADVLRVVRDLAGDIPGRLLLAGDRWPDPARDRSAQRASAATLLAGGLPQQLGDGRDVTVLADLLETPSGWLPRLLLAVNAERVLVAVAAGSLQDNDAAVLSDKFRFEVRRVGGADVVDATRQQTPSSAVVATLLTKAHGRVASVWRDALIAQARRRGATLTKNQARALVAEAVPQVTRPGGVRLVEAPLHVLHAVVAAARASEPAAAE